MSLCEPFKDWDHLYRLPVLNFKEEDRILGGEIMSWSETVDWTNIETRIFPRASAAAEALWTGKLDKRIPINRFV